MHGHDGYTRLQDSVLRQHTNIFLTPKHECGPIIVTPIIYQCPADAGIARFSHQPSDDCHFSRH
jgi:hypothetical protein